MATKRKPYKKKSLTKRQEASLKRHGEHHSASHMKFMKRKMMSGTTMRAAHKAAMAKKGK
jgi:pyruvate carboxylase